MRKRIQETWRMLSEDGAEEALSISTERARHLLSVFQILVQVLPLILYRLRPLSLHRRHLIKSSFLLFSFLLCFFRIQEIKKIRAAICWTSTLPSPLNSYKTLNLIHSWGSVGFRRLPSQAVASLTLESELRCLSTGQDFHGQIYKLLLHQNHGDGGGRRCCRVLLERKIPRAHPAVTSLNLWGCSLGICIWRRSPGVSLAFENHCASSQFLALVREKGDGAGELGGTGVGDGGRR